MIVTTIPKVTVIAVALQWCNQHLGTCGLLAFTTTECTSTAPACLFVPISVLLAAYSCWPTLAHFGPNLFNIPIGTSICLLMLYRPGTTHCLLPVAIYSLAKELLVPWGWHLLEDKHLWFWIMTQNSYNLGHLLSAVLVHLGAWRTRLLPCTLHGPGRGVAFLVLKWEEGREEGS